MEQDNKSTETKQDSGITEPMSTEEEHLAKMEASLEEKINNFSNPKELAPTPEQEAEIFKRFHEQLLKLDPKERTKVLRYFRQKQESINPDQSSYTTVTDDQRKHVLERYKMQRAQMQMARKSVATKNYLMKKHQEKLKKEEDEKKAKEEEDKKAKEEVTSVNTHVHSENCNHEHEKDKMSKSKKKREKLKAKLAKLKAAKSTSEITLTTNSNNAEKVEPTSST
jgi:hypothetical protein